MSAWATASLGDVCQMISRGIAPAYLEQGGTLVINQKCIRDHTVNYALGRRHDSTAKRIAVDRLVRRGDALVNSTGTGTLGRVAQVRDDPPEPATVDTHVTIVRPNLDKFHLDFFGYVMIILEDRLTASGTGLGGQTELARKTIESFQISFPEEIEEQRRIAAMLDEALAAIATAIVNTEKNLANARELLESQGEQLFSALKESGAPLMALGDLTAANSSITYGVVKPGPEGSVPFVRGGDLVDGAVRVGQLRTISKEFSEQYRRTLLQGGELLICLVGTPGECAIAPPELAGANIARQVGLMRLNEDKVSSEYVRDFLLSGLGQKLLGLRTGGSVQQVINLGDLKLIEIPVPPIEEQLAIVSRIRTLKEAAIDLRAMFERKLAALAQLKQSLLHRAFAGELTHLERELVPA